MGALRFESRLADRIARKQKQDWPWKRIAGAVFIVFVVLTLTASTMAASGSVIQLTGKHAFARYVGFFDGKTNTLMAGISSSDSWVVVKVPFKGTISDLQSICFSEFLVQLGGSPTSLEPYVVLKLPHGHSLVCYPADCYSNGEWSLPYFNWQMRDTVAKGQWVEPSAEYKITSMMTLETWGVLMSDPSVIQIWIVIGGWDISKPYKVYLGDLTVNGSIIDLSNAKRTNAAGSEPPVDF